MASPLTWLVTGCSSGIGEELVLAILRRGDRAIATARAPVSRLQHLADAGATTFELDVNLPQKELEAKLNSVKGLLDQVDVVVNNAGYIESGLLELLSTEAIRRQLDTNLYGSINVTRAFLPSFRKRRSGTVVFIGSMLGWEGIAGGLAYGASKFALEGVAETLQKETSAFGIRTLLIEPGMVRTKMFSPQNVKVPEGLDGVDDDLKPFIQGSAEMLKGADGNQPGDAVKSAERIVDLVRQEGVVKGKEVPLRMPLGEDALAMIKKKCLDTLRLLEDWEDVILSTRRDDSAAVVPQL